VCSSDLNAFTFIEIVVAMFIFSIIGAIIAGGVISGNKIKASQEALIEIQQNIRVANMLMARDIRMAGYELGPHFNSMMRRSVVTINAGKTDPDGNPCPNNSDSIQFQMVMDMNLGKSTATITYYLQDVVVDVGEPAQRCLMRRYQNPGEALATDQDRTDVVATNIDALWVTYYVSNGASNLLWSSVPVNPPSPLPAVMTGVPVTRSMGITLVGSSTKQNKDFLGHPRTFTEPNVGIQSHTFTDQLDHRMYSTVVGLNNFNAQM
jgi:type II secretory pathway component PulJ